MQYNIIERYELKLKELTELVENYNAYESKIQELVAERNKIANKIVSIQGVLEELKPFLPEKVDN